MRRSRAVVLALPLTKKTHHLVGASQIGLMPDDSVLVNIGRGSTVDEEAVADALASGHLAAYATDVFAMEDVGLSTRPTEIAASLLSHPRCVFTPHIGSATATARRAVETQAARSILQALWGMRPEGAVNLPVTPERVHVAEKVCQ
jgi:phosphonate dehydrogenase